MRLKALTLFLAIQVLSFFVWKTMSTDIQVMAEGPAQTTHAVSEEKIQPEFSVRHFSDSQENLNDVLQERIKKALNSLPAEHVNTIEDIVLDYDTNAYRGLGGNNLIILRGVRMDEKEFIGVLVHETAHNVDYGFLVHKKEEKISNFKDGSYPLYITDLSVDFYRISWEDENTLKNTASNLDFVSGYAMSDPFEDFAETYTYYVLHNEDFKALVSSSPNLYAKYRFMKYRVFDGVEFNTGDGEVRIHNRPWDTTLLNYELEEFLAS
jgi:hypothetical protein